jgi:pimeloyl-ACP methyl ester carboxylesterase
VLRFVLVHGGWHGGWCWRDTARHLRSLGHEAFTPTLIGLGERSHLLSAAINLDTHITDVMNVIEYEGLSDVVLVGHSYGSMVVTGVADRMRDRIASLVYVDAFLPEDGDSVLSLTSDELRRFLMEGAAGSGGLASPSATGPGWRSIEGWGPNPFAATYERLREDPGWITRTAPCGHDVMIDLPEELAGWLVELGRQLVDSPG